MPSARDYSLDLRISGILDPSLAATIKKAEAQVNALYSSVKSRNAALGSIYRTAFAPQAVTKAIDGMNTLQDRFKSLGSVITGVGIGSLLSEGIQVGINKAQELGEAISSAVQKAGEFTRTKEQLAIELGKSSSDPYTQGIIEKLQQYSFSTHLVPDVLLEAFRQTKTSGFTDEETFKRIQEIANISGATVPHGENASTAFLELMDVFNKAAKGGAALEKTLYAFEKRGVGLRGIIAREVGLDVPADVLNLDPDDPRAQAIDTILAKLIKARKVPFAPIGGAISQLGGPGGKYDVMSQFSKDLLGAESTLQGSFDMLFRELGHAFEGPLTQLINSINSYFNWDKFKATQDFLDSFAAKTNTAFKPLLDIMAKGDWTTVGKSFTTMLDELGKVLQKSQPIFEAMAKDLPGEISDLLRLATVIEHIGLMLEKAFKWADNLLPKESTPAPGDTVDSLGNVIHALHNLEKQTDKVTGNDLVHMNLAIDEATQKLLNFAGALPGGGGAAGGGLLGGSAGSSSGFTIYGPGVAGDQPGGPTYDWDSYHGIGHIGGVPYSLSGGDAAMKAAWAEGHYHIKPGDSYISDKDHKLHRWRDTSGSRNPENEDIYVPKGGAQIIFNVHAMDTAGIDRVLHEHGPRFLEHLKRLQGDENERSAVI
jgi:hypothetical protein